MTQGLQQVWTSSTDSLKCFEKVKEVLREQLLVDVVSGSVGEWPARRGKPSDSRIIDMVCN